MSAATIDLEEDDGIVEVKLPGGGLPLDLYAVNDRLVEIGTASKGKPSEEYVQALADYMATLGLPSMSFRMRLKFVKGIFDAVEQLGNGDGRAGAEAKPGSPASTGPTL